MAVEVTHETIDYQDGGYLHYYKKTGSPCWHGVSRYSENGCDVGATVWVNNKIREWLEDKPRWQ